MESSSLSRSNPKPSPTKGPQKRTALERGPNRMAHPTSAAMKPPAFFEEDRLAVDAALERLLPQESARPTSIHQAMRYSVFAGGKRIRPILSLETARIFAADITAALHPACAIEMIHTYSLIHDDLPALDNDDLRRGKPTCHKKFGEAAAILAGDALLTLAFETISATPVAPAIPGLERSHEISNDLPGKAISELAHYREAASRLKEIAEYLVIRRT